MKNFQEQYVSRMNGTVKTEKRGLLLVNLGSPSGPYSLASVSNLFSLLFFSSQFLMSSKFFTAVEHPCSRGRIVKYEGSINELLVTEYIVQ